MRGVFKGTDNIAGIQRTKELGRRGERVSKKDFRDKGAQWGNRGETGSHEVRGQLRKSRMLRLFYLPW